MIAAVECRHCYGLGRVHSAGHNGDPMDLGEDCPVCLGAGVVDDDLNEEADVPLARLRHPAPLF